MPVQAEAVCLGILKGVYDFQWHSKTEFKNWAIDAPSEYFWIYLEEWKKHFQQPSSTSRMNQFHWRQQTTCWINPSANTPAAYGKQSSQHRVSLASVPTITCWTVWRSARTAGKLAVGMFTHLSFVISKV